MQDFVTEFHQKMRAAGFEPKGGKVLADGKWHQAAYGDEKHKYSGTYILNITPDGRFANGNFWTRKDPDNRHKWHSKPDKEQKSDPAEIKRQQALIKRQQADKEAAEARRQEKIALRLARVCEALPPEPGDHPYLKRKGVRAHGLLWRKKGNELVMPLADASGKIWSIQRITTDGGKYLFTGARKQGNFFLFKGTPRGIILVCEGYATGASIFEATGITTAAAIDSGNLKAVLKALQRQHPTAKFVICSDNDAFTLNAKKEPWNVGLDKANEAAGAIGGAFVVHPEIVNAKNTDYNDLHSAQGLEAVKASIMACVDKISVSELVSDAPVVAETLVSDQHHNGSDILPPEYNAIEPQPQSGDFGMNFKVLGYDEEYYYYFSFSAKIIMRFAAPAHTLSNLMRLDTLEAWQNKFGGTDASDKNIVKYATNALIQKAIERGFFKEEDTVRGTGAWMDAGRKILHCGDVLYIDGAETDFSEIHSEYTYIASKKLMRPTAEPLSNAEAYKLRQICEAPTWENKLSGSLLAGYLVIAPICGALAFRPHVWITGLPDSGKSTIIDRIVKPVIGKISVNLSGRTTEPKIREVIGYGSRPVVFDEAEKSDSIDAVLDLSRLCTDGQSVGKFGQKIFKGMSCFCFSAVNPPVNTTANESRIVFMTIRQNTRETALQEYNALLDMIHNTIDLDYSSRMISRTLKHIDALFKNIHTFQQAARIVIKGARASQVIGTLLAGLYLLSKTDVISQEAAEEWIRKYDWSGHTTINAKKDHEKLLQYICRCILRYTAQGATKEMTIGELIYLTHRENDTIAKKLLRQHGIDVDKGKVYFSSTSHHLGKLLRDTEWSIKWTPMLENVIGAEKFTYHYFGVGDRTSGTSIPMSAFMEDDNRSGAPELPLKEGQEIPF